MKTSFYIVLWSLVWLLIIYLDIPILNQNGLLSACIMVYFLEYIARKLLVRHLEYQAVVDNIAQMETAYQNNYKQHKRGLFIEMLVNAIWFVYIVVILLNFFLSVVYTPFIDYVIWVFFTIIAGRQAWQCAISYNVEKRRTGWVVLDSKLQAYYPEYRTRRATYSYEELLPTPPENHQLMKIFNYLIATLSVSAGLVILFLLHRYIDYSNIDLWTYGMIIYGVMAIYSGVKDIQRFAKGKRLPLLLLACILAFLFYCSVVSLIESDSDAIIIRQENVDADADADAGIYL